MRRFTLPALALPLVACIGCADEPLEGDIIAIGDSIFDWNREGDNSVPDVVGEELGLTVANAAIGGTKLTVGPEAIPDQYQAGEWQAVVMDGGGNDVNDECGCGECDDVMDAIISADGTAGVVPDFAAEVNGAGIPVVFWSYYELPDDAEFGFDRCGEELVTLVDRLALLAAAEPDFHLVDGRDVVKASDTQYYDEDRVHPSVEGGRVVGQQIAAVIEAL